MTTFNDIMAKFEDTGLLREVKETPAYFPTPTGLQVIPNKKALVFADDGSYVSTVGDKYKVIQNEEVYSSVAEGLLTSGLDLEGMSIKTIGTNESRHLAMINLPNHSIFTGTSNETSMQIAARNSHDGSWKQRIDIGGFRIACANGQVAGNIIQAYGNTHTSGFNIKRLGEHFLKSLDGFEKMGALWIHMMRTHVTEEQVNAAILKYLDKTQPGIVIDASELTQSSPRFRQLRGMWNAYKREMGSNAYALYNVFTDDASHQSQNPVTITNRQGKIEPVLADLMAA